LDDTDGLEASQRATNKALGVRSAVSSKAVERSAVFMASISITCSQTTHLDPVLRGD
jgi:hypothetical protein